MACFSQFIWIKVHLLINFAVSNTAVYKQVIKENEEPAEFVAWLSTM